MSNKYSVSSHVGNNREKKEAVQLVSSASHDHDSSFRRNGKTTSEASTVEEKEKFLSPVTLDPGCDSVNFTPDPEVVKAHSEQEPLDRYRMVFIIMVIHGMGVLMPWNMFITAKSYFENYKLDTPISHNASYRLEFLFYLGIASQVSNVVISALNTFVQFGAQASTRRIAMAIFIIVIVFILTVVLAIVDSSQWPMEFFAITMVSVVILNCCAGVYQNSVFGQAAILPMKYTNAIVLGNNLCGIFTSVINVISIAASPSPKTAAVYYFIVAIVILLVAFDAYFVLPLTKFYQHFQKKVKGAKAKSNMTCADYSEQFVKSCKMYWQVFKEIWVQALCVFFVFFVSLSIFPAIQSGVVGMEIAMAPEYFVTLFCFLNFNLFAFIGNLVSEFVKFPGPKYVWIPVLLRVLFIPFFILCNYNPTKRSLPVIISSDYAYIIGGSLMSFTSGYYSSLTMMYGPKLVDPQKAGRAGMLMAFCLVLGITLGVNFALLITKMITQV